MSGAEETTKTGTTTRRPIVGLTASLWAVCILGLGVVLLFLALSRNLVFFHSPSEVIANSASFATGVRFRLGGRIVPGSLTRSQTGDGEAQVFRVSDITDSIDSTDSADSADSTGSTVEVRYIGILPPLFGDGEEVIVDGQLEDVSTENTGGTDIVIRAEGVFSRHDARYRPLSDDPF
ncbi:MAG: cytochrome c maturation protein CcmE [Alphaproteobacteria bacterium]